MFNIYCFALVAKSWKQSKQLLKAGWLNKDWSAIALNYYIAIKKNKLISKMFMAALSIITPTPISSRMHKQILVYPHNRILYSNQNKQTTTIMNVIILYKKVCTEWFQIYKAQNRLKKTNALKVKMMATLELGWRVGVRFMKECIMGILGHW